MASHPPNNAMPSSGQVDRRSPAQKAQRTNELRLEIANADGGDIVNCITEHIPTVDLQFNFLIAFGARYGYKRLLFRSTCNIINNPTLIRDLYSRVPHAQETFAPTISRRVQDVTAVDTARHAQLGRFITNNHDSVVRDFLQQFFNGQTQGADTSCWGCLRKIRKSYDEGSMRLCGRCVSQWLVWQKMGEVERDRLCLGAVTSWDSNLPQITTPFSSFLRLIKRSLPELYQPQDLNNYFAIPVHGHSLRTIQSGAISQVVLRRNLLQYIINQALVHIPDRLAQHDWGDQLAKDFVSSIHGSFDMHAVSNTGGWRFRALAVKAVHEKLRISGILQLLTDEGVPALLGVTWPDLRRHNIGIENKIRREGKGALCVLAGVLAHEVHPLTTADQYILQVLAEVQQDPTKLEHLHPDVFTALEAISVDEVCLFWQHYRTTPQYEWLYLLEIVCMTAFPFGTEGLPPIAGGRYPDPTTDQAYQQLVEAIAQNEIIPGLTDKLKLIKYLAATRFLTNFFNSEKFFGYMRALNRSYTFCVRASARRVWDSTALGTQFLSHATSDLPFYGNSPFERSRKFFETAAGGAAVYVHQGA